MPTKASEGGTRKAGLKPRDEYEKQLLDQLRRVTPEVRPTAEDFLRLFDQTFTRIPEKVRTLRSSLLMERMTFFLDRSMQYSHLYELWRSFAAVDPSSSLFTQSNAINVFGPFLLEELEGPLKYELGIIRFLIGLAVGEDSKWPESLIRDPSTGQQHTFGHLFSEIRKRSAGYPSLEETMKVFEGSDSRLDFEVLRNALSHSDYWIEKDATGLKVHLEAGGRSQLTEAREFLSVFTGVQDLVLGLQMAVLIAMHRIGQQ